MCPSSSFVKTVVSILIGIATTWALFSFIPSTAQTLSPNQPPALSFSPAPGYDGVDALDPNDGSVNTPLNFAVVYTDPENHPAVITEPVIIGMSLIRAALAQEEEEEGIKLFVFPTAGFPLELRLRRDTTPDPDFPHLHDGDYTNGEQYSLSDPAVFSSLGAYQYFFEANDGSHSVLFPGYSSEGEFLTFSFALINPPPSNHAPTLSYSQDSGYLTDGVNPDKGTASLTELAFKTIYTDQDNDPPQNIFLYIDTGSVNLAPLPFVPDVDSAVPAALHDGNFTNGEQYAYTSTFPKGQYQYHFEASDGEESARLPATSELTLQTGYSNVAFLPGYGGSRLYQYDPDCIIINCENQLWEPNIPFIPDINQLSMNADGSPVHSDIYTKQGSIIDETLQNPKWPGSNVYKKFIEFMNGEMEGSIINTWEPLPYDWRLPLETIVNTGVYRAGGVFSDLVDEIENLAATSANGKVTLIGHSNGGLLAKVLINRLKSEGKASLIDRLVMVGTPQLGTPKSMRALLHGEFPTYETTRELAENMVSVYNFLPSPVYFQRVDSPVIEFDAEVSNIYDFRGIYEEDINTVGEFTKFLLGDNGLRSEPLSGDTDAPNVLKESLLAQAQGTHADLDLWTPPAGIEVVQIAGWGKDTIRGIRYDDCDIPFCSQTLSHLDRKMLETQDGDGTVVVPSATAMPVDDYFINFKSYNRAGEFQRNREHADMLEVESVQELIRQLLQNSFNQNDPPEFIELEKPTPKSTQKTLHLRGLSPITIDVYDSFGNHTGPVPNPDPSTDLEFFEMQIPNSYYYKIGEKTYIGLDTQDQYRLEIDGLALGSFTLEIDEVFNDEVIDTIAYANIAVTPDTKASLTTQTVDTTSSLSLDVQGDGKPDVTVFPSEKPDPKASLKTLKQVVNALSMQKAVKNAIIKQIEAVELALNKRLPKIADSILKGLVKQLQSFPKFLINPADAQALIQIIETIRASLV